MISSQKKKVSNYVHDPWEMQHVIIRREKFLVRILVVESRVVET